jgi:hypothetical protein
MKRAILLPGLSLLLLLCGFALLPAAAAPVGGEPVAGWVPAGSLPAELLQGREPRIDGLADQARALAIGAMGRSYRWIAFRQETPVFTKNPAGRYSFLMGIRFGIIFDGTDVELKQRAARGLYDQVVYVRAAATQEGEGWGPVSLSVAPGGAIPVPALPEGGPAGSGETVRGWAIVYTGQEPEPPIGAGLSLSDGEQLRPVVEQLGGYPAAVIAGVDPADPNLLVSSQLIATGVVAAGGETEAILIVRTVNTYQRAPWMESLWQTDVTQATDVLDAAAAQAGVAPAQVASQRLLLKRTAEGWEVAEARIIPGAYTVTVEPPTVADRVIGGLGMLNVRVPASIRQAEPVDPATGAAATAAGMTVLAAWAGAQALSMVRGRVSLGQVGGAPTRAAVAGAVGESAGSKVAKFLGDAMDWLFRPVERPLSLLMKNLGRRSGLFRYLTEEEGGAELAVPTARVVAGPGGRGAACGTCGATIAQGWHYCTGCGSNLAGVGDQVAAGGGGQ